MFRYRTIRALYTQGDASVPTPHPHHSRPYVVNEKERSMRTDFQHLLVNQDGGVLTITMNRPEVLNAFNDVMLAELTEAMEAVAQDETVRCVALTGAGRAFGSGQDLRSLAEGRSSGAIGTVSRHVQKYHRVVLAISSMPKPVIAAVRGAAAGISC